MEKNKVWVWIIIIVVIVGVIFLIKNNKKTTDTDTPSDTVSDTQPESVQDTTETTGAGAVLIAYGEALEKYADRRIQLGADCQAHPNNVTYKDNTGIMIDNRSAETLKVKIGSTYTIKPWGFKIVVLPNIYLQSKTILVDCNESQNVATILVQE